MSRDDLYSPGGYAYELPGELIAQSPAAQRDRSRLLVLPRHEGPAEHRRFSELPEYLSPGDLLVVNNTRVVPARLYGTKETGGRVEALIIDYAAGARAEAETGLFTAECLVRASKRPRQGSYLLFDGGLRAGVKEVRDRVCLLAFESGGAMQRHLQTHGRAPLPPYIQRDNPLPGDDREDYQCVYAERDGAVAAPTAGLHFTPELLARLDEKGVRRADVTLHVGYGTFMPVQVDDVRKHSMHGEWVEVGEDTAREVRLAKHEGRRVVAVGTTTVRSLEWAARETGEVRAVSGDCSLFIYSGFRFNAVDAMVTNFHLPGSTLLMLVSAFAGRDRVLAAYQEAVALRYRFFSYGDAMLLF
ncbi:MAG: tRNA preQ1(34) S-adenosylmethionine ribosyltransferase-isomerase QueA [Desulfatibacillaceae bacterium]